LNKGLNIAILNPPSPPHFDVCKDWAGGFGTAAPVKRRGEHGHSGEPLFYAFLPYASWVLSKENYNYSILDCQRLRLNKFQVLAEVKKRNPDLIFSLIGLPSLKRDLKLLDSIKESIRNTTIVGVGTSCRFLQSHILLNSKIDAALRVTIPMFLTLQVSSRLSSKNKIVRSFSKQRIMGLLPYASKKPRFVLNELKKTIKGYLM